MKKTPLQKLIQWVDEYIENYGMMPTSFDVNQKANSLLPQEMDDMMQSYSDGIGNGMSQPDELKYFNETFEQ